MRISKEAAVDNKARVLEVAKRLLREKGFSGLGVAEVMKEAGFTHGGFYNHFGSKENLAVEAVQSAFDEAVSRVAAKAAEARNPRRRREAFRHYVDRYLSIKTRDAPGRACPMAALGTDAARHGQPLKAPFAKGVERYLEAFAGVVPNIDGHSSTRQTAIVIISTLIGALTLSRACAGANNELSEEILSVVHNQLLKG